MPQDIVIEVIAVAVMAPAKDKNTGEGRAGITEIGASVVPGFPVGDEPPGCLATDRSDKFTGGGKDIEDIEGTNGGNILADHHIQDPTAFGRLERRRRRDQLTGKIADFDIGARNAGNLGQNSEAKRTAS